MLVYNPDCNGSPGRNTFNMSAELQRPALTHVAAQSARSVPNLVALLTTLAAAMLFANPWLVLAGGWLYFALIVRNVASPRFRRKVLQARAEAFRQIPDESSLSDPGLQLIARSIRKAYDEITRVLRNTPEPIRAHVQVAVASLDDLRGQAAQLIRDADELGAYLLTTPREVTEGEIRRLHDALGRAQEYGGKLEYQSALSVREDQLAAVARVALEHERILASLRFIVGTLETFPAWIYRLRVLEHNARNDLVNETNEQLVRMKLDLATSQSLLEGLAPAAAEKAD